MALRKPCYVVQVNPISGEETVIGVYESQTDCARAMGSDAPQVCRAIKGHSMTAFGCFIMQGEPPVRRKR